MRQRPRAILAVPLLALAVLAAACNPFGGLGPDELPERIGEKEREQITKMLAGFFDAVSRGDPQLVSEFMPIGEMKRVDVLDMVQAVQAIHDAEARIEFLRLGSTTLGPQSLDVRAVTSAGDIDLVLVRREGLWRLIELPSLDQYIDVEWSVSVEIVNEYVDDDGRLVTLGWVVHDGGDEPAIVGRVSALYRGESAREASELLGSDILLAAGLMYAGERAPFKIVASEFPPDDPETLVRAFYSRFNEADLDSFAGGLTVTAKVADSSEAPSVEVTVTNGHVADAHGVVGYWILEDAAGRLLDAGSALHPVLAAGQTLLSAHPLTVRDGLPLDAHLQSSVWGNIPPQSQ